jgi:hypothetical protein
MTHAVVVSQKNVQEIFAAYQPTLRKIPEERNFIYTATEITLVNTKLALN